MNVSRKTRRPAALIVVFGLIFATLFGVPQTAYAADTGAVSGTVVATDGAPVADASVTLEGPQRQSTRTDGKGAFKFAGVLAGFYTLVVTKAGYDTARNDEVSVFIGQEDIVKVVLSPASFSSLRTIASVTTNNPGVAPINRSTAAVSSISGGTFANQGQQQVTKVLNETPGILTSPYNSSNGNPSNGGSPASFQTPQIRAALPYETESLIDGHPVSVGSAGFYSPNLLNPWLLQDVELVKGPGSMPQSINYAINGTVNYRTLDPTSTPHQSVMLGYDNWGGLSSGVKATGSTTNHKLGYAIGYASTGAPGPLKNFSFKGTQLPLTGGPPGGPYFMNGQQVAMVGGVVGIGPGAPQYAKYDGMGISFVDPVVGCCYKMDTGYHSLSELAKLVVNFSNSTSFTMSYLGGQNQYGNGDPNAYSVAAIANTGLPAAYFAPCGSASEPLTCNPFATGGTYNCPAPVLNSGPPACNSAVPFDISSVNGVGYTWNQQNLFQGEFRSTLGKTGTVLGRYYTGSLNLYAVLGPASGKQINYSMNTFGTIPLCPTGTTFDPNPPAAIGGPDLGGFQCLINPANPNDPANIVAPVNTTFTGQKVNYSTANNPNTFFTNDTMNGETLEVQELLGQNTVTLAYDRSEQASASTANEPSVGIIVFSPVKGSKQTFDTFSVRGNILANPKLQANVGLYGINYTSHFSIDGGKTFNDASHSYFMPRAAFTWHPNVDTAFRLSTGGSIAPPYISLISSGGPTWSQIIGGVPSAGWIQDANSGDINAETAWNYDIGIDRRIQRSTAVSLDLYFTQLHNLFLTQTAVVSGAPATGCPNQPCEVSKTANLGQARYQGIELTVNHAPQFGLGWKLQGSFQRAFTYNLPPFFYCAGTTDPNTGVTTPPGPGCLNNTNLAVIPEVNFGGQPTALAGSPNGISSARVPYALGYGELNFAGHYGQYYNLGLTYFGNNNSFNVPAFAVVSANARFSLTNHGTSLQISGDNLTNAYANQFAGFFNGIPLPLVGGAIQTNPLTGAFQPASLALTPGGNFGPATWRLILVQDF